MFIFINLVDNAIVIYVDAPFGVNLPIRAYLTMYLLEQIPKSGVLDSWLSNCPVDLLHHSLQVFEVR